MNASVVVSTASGFLLLLLLVVMVLLTADWRLGLNRRRGVADVKDWLLFGRNLSLASLVMQLLLLLTLRGLLDMTVMSPGPGPTLTPSSVVRRWVTPAYRLATGVTTFQFLATSVYLCLFNTTGNKRYFSKFWKKTGLFGNLKFLTFRPIDTLFQSCLLNVESRQSRACVGKWEITNLHGNRCRVFDLGCKNIALPGLVN